MKTKHLFITLLALLAVSCSGGGPEIPVGDVFHLHKGTVEWIINGVQQGEYLTTVFVREADDLVVYSRPFVDNVAFVITKAGEPLDEVSQVGGNLVCCKTWQEFVKWMVAAGFRPVGYGAKYYVEVLLRLGSTEIIPIFTIAPMDTFEFAPDWLVPVEEDA